MRIQLVSAVTLVTLHGCGSREIPAEEDPERKLRPGQFIRPPHEEQMAKVLLHRNAYSGKADSLMTATLSEEVQKDLFRKKVYNVADTVVYDLRDAKSKVDVEMIRDRAFEQLVLLSEKSNGDGAIDSAKRLIQLAVDEAMSDMDDQQEALAKDIARKLRSSVVARMKAIEQAFANSLSPNMEPSALFIQKDKALMELSALDLTGSPNLESARADVQRKIESKYDVVLREITQANEPSEAQEQESDVKLAIDAILDRFKPASIAAQDLEALNTALHEADQALQEVPKASGDKLQEAQSVMNTFKQMAVGRIQRALSAENDRQIVARAGATGILDKLVPLPEFPPISAHPFKVPRLPEKDAALHPRIREMLAAQLARDAQWPDSAPYLLYDSEILGDGTRIQIGDTISQKEDVMVFHLSSSHPALPAPKKVIKYQSNCYSLNSALLDLERDYWFLKEVEHLGISPKAVFLSPPGDLPSFVTPKIAFETGLDALRECAEHPRAYIRYMVMDMIPETVWKLLHKNVGHWGDRFFLAMNMAISLIEKLERLHAIGIIHGDVHVDNIAKLDAGDTNFGLIDYGKAFFDDEYKDKSNYSHWDSHCFLSSNNLKNVRFGFRDDVYKTLLAAGFLMTKTALYNHCIGLGPKRVDLIQFHETYFLFDAPRVDSIYTAFPLLSVEQRGAIRGRLANALALSRSVVDVRDKPDYGGIVRNLKEAVQLARNPN